MPPRASSAHADRQLARRARGVEAQVGSRGHFIQAKIGVVAVSQPVVDFVRQPLRASQAFKVVRRPRHSYSPPFSTSALRSLSASKAREIASSSPVSIACVI